MKKLEDVHPWSTEYPVERRKDWYSGAAEAYNRTRPRYPREIIDRAVELAQLPSAAALLEIGCGPGIATVEFAQLGFSMLCLEPSKEACQFARQNCAAYPQVEIQNCMFEEWTLEPERFNAILAASSLHWVSAETRYSKTAAALQNNGSLILLWNFPPQPSYDVYQALEEVYQLHAPSLAKYEDKKTHESNISAFGEAAISSSLFGESIVELMPCEIAYEVDDYLALLSTLSPYIALEPQNRADLFAGLRSVLERECGEAVQTKYFSAVQVMKKI
ncbi:MAG: class I SAM-dependent methyltransferase [Myxacorys chilensis ATA2-1-KO14]|jgi:SAM-dependent methyltransferase|nr:class I SAM-dependent methyltransferase [Myxacorys chilensis ATA2-1-KO14]